MEIISSADAHRAGLTRYFTGKPCPRGHVAERYVSTFGCVMCGAVIAQEAKEKRNAARAAKPLSPRQAAKQVSAISYVPDAPCSRCMTSRRMTSNGSCYQCVANAARETYQEDAELRDRRAEYRRTDAKERLKAHTRNRRSAILGMTEKHTPEDVWALFDEQEGRCPYCDVYLREWHVDHKDPISRGGSNSKQNLQLTCETCNLRKHAKTDAEFRAVLAAERALASALAVPKS